MNMQAVAYSELTRVLPWSLRALGYPFGTADRGSFLIANAAALNHDVLDDFASSAPRPAAGLRCRAEAGTLTIDAGGISLVEAGPVAMDYMAAHADKSDLQLCRISSASGQSLLPAVLLTGAEYGLSLLAVIAGNDEPISWQAISAGQAGPVMISGKGVTSLSTALARHPELVARALEAEKGGGELAIVATSRPLQFEAAGMEPFSPQRSIEQAYRKGIAVAPETLQAIYDLEVITWAPTSERSRSQAGYGNSAVISP